jgi:cystathionine gamma-synthase
VDGGAVVARSRPLASALQTAAREHGTTASAFDSWLLLRDAKTLPVRVRRHETNARSLAYDLREHPAVDRVFYPGLRGHPDHETARAQQDGYGHLVSFVVDPDAVDVETLIAATALFRDAAGIGGTDSRICRPDGPAVPDGLVRLSIGIEATADLADDLAQALDAAHTGEAPTPSRPSGAGTRSSPCARAAAPSRP